jgi:hypothetical protein
MAKLDPFFGPHSGDLKIWVRNFPVGTGAFGDFSDFQATFDGSYSAFGKKGTFDIAFALTDKNPGAQSGPCTITLNGKTDNAATYQVNGGKLTITTTLNTVPIAVYTSEGGTQVDNISGLSIWIG